MKNRRSILLILIILLSLFMNQGVLQAEELQKSKYIPPQGYVPDEETAIKIAVAVWIPIYGSKKIGKEKPYKAILKDDIWYVYGSLPEGYIGGVAEAQISRNNGCIIEITHGK